jgi:hypothetical protein
MILLCFFGGLFRRHCDVRTEVSFCLISTKELSGNYQKRMEHHFTYFCRSPQETLIYLSFWQKMAHKSCYLGSLPSPDRYQIQL